MPCIDGSASGNSATVGTAGACFFGRGKISAGAANATSNTLNEELATLADEKDAVFRKASAMLLRGEVFAVMGNASDAVQLLTSEMTAFRSTGATQSLAYFLALLAQAHSQLGQDDDAWRCIGEATKMVETTKERWFEADISSLWRGSSAALERTGRCESTRIFQPRADRRSLTTSKIVGATRCHDTAGSLKASTRVI
jgi:hypothetical protein